MRTFGPALLQARQDRVFELTRDCLSETLRGWIRNDVNVLLVQFHDARGVENRLAGKQKIAHRTDGIKVAARVDGIRSLNRFRAM